VIVFVLGTRPEALKLRPLADELRIRGMPFRLLSTGQHAGLLMGTGLPLAPEFFSLCLPSDNHPDAYVARATEALWAHLVGSETSLIVVQGDTASALAGARAGLKLGIPVAHIEAGLRSGDRSDPWPEEGYRIEIDQLASLRFAPTVDALLNLAAEGLDGMTTGNTSVDALRLAGLDLWHPPTRAGLLVTLHRRESFGEPMRKLFDTVWSFAATHPDLAITWPLHPNPEVMRHCLTHQALPNIDLCPPLPHEEFLKTLYRSFIVLTDSGGLIEEACTLGIPTVIARNHTERPEAITAGSAVLAGTTPVEVAKALDWALTTTIQPSTVFGDGFASTRIAEQISAFLASERILERF
jgi:UDP-N-acetylglucosamine 2-epimerase (non-hydrolysing)